MNCRIEHLHNKNMLCVRVIGILKNAHLKICLKCVILDVLHQFGCTD